MRILLAEDEIELSDALTVILEHNEYTIDKVYDGNEAFKKGSSHHYDGIILDIMMPGMDGITVLHKLRKQSIKTPVMMLTAKNEIDNRIEGLDNGADDYLGKPFHMGELLARLRAMLRRKNEFSPASITIGNVTLDRPSLSLSNGEMSFCLSSDEFQVMELLFEGKDQMIANAQIMERVWGDSPELDDRAAQIQISFLQKKLQALDEKIEIQSLPEQFYRLRVNT